MTNTNIEKALALIEIFTTGDVLKTKELLADEYIQHNLVYGTGTDAFIGSVSYLVSAPVKTMVNNIRAITEDIKMEIKLSFGRIFKKKVVGSEWNSDNLIL